MRSAILQEAPLQFDHRFLEWLRELQGLLLIRFMDWGPSSSEDAQSYEKIIRQAPKALKLYYENAYPFGRLRNGWSKWDVRKEEYNVIWRQSLVSALGTDPDHAKSLVDSSPMLWPICCLERNRDIVGFLWENGEIIVIELDLSAGGRGKPVAVGLRNYFLVQVALQLLAEDMIEVDFDRLRLHPTVLAVSGWPQEPPFPEHVALTIGERLR